MRAKSRTRKTGEVRRTLVIPVEKWLHSDLLGTALYRTSDGKMCCLGLYLNACGLPEEVMADIDTPNYIEEARVPDEASWLLSSSGSDDAWDLMYENDRNADRKKIARIFAKHNVDVVFQGAE